MYELCAISGTELSEYVIQLLHKQEIHTILQFLETDFVKLSKITNVSEECIARIKNKLRLKYAPQPIKLRNHSAKISNSVAYYRTGIENVDTMLKSNFSGGQLIEICGVSGIGKSLLCMTIAVNFTINYGVNILYIDTKNDFSAGCVKRILCSKQGLSDEEIEKAMTRIIVERTYSAEGIIKILEELLQQIRNGSGAGTDIKIVIIDSLPAIWNLFHGEDYSLEGKYFLSKLANLMRRLANDHFLLFVFVNLLVPIDEIPDESAETAETYETKSTQLPPAKRMKLMPAWLSVLKASLGKYWKGVPTLSLAMEEMAMTSDPELRQIGEHIVIRVTKSCCSPTGEQCQVLLTDAGVI